MFGVTWPGTMGDVAEPVRRVLVVSATEAPDGLVRVILPDGSMELIDAGLSDDQLGARFQVDEVRRAPRIIGIPYRPD